MGGFANGSGGGGLCSEGSLAMCNAEAMWLRIAY